MALMKKPSKLDLENVTCQHCGITKIPVKAFETQPYLLSARVGTRRACKECVSKAWECVNCHALTTEIHKQADDRLLCTKCCPTHAFWAENEVDWLENLKIAGPRTPLPFHACVECGKETVLKNQGYCHACMEYSYWCVRCTTWRGYRDPDRNRDDAEEPDDRFEHGRIIVTSDPTDGGFQVLEVCGPCYMDCKDCMLCGNHADPTVMKTLADPDGFTFSACGMCLRDTKPCYSCKREVPERDLDAMPDAVRVFDPAKGVNIMPRHCGACRRTKFRRCDRCGAQAPKDTVSPSAPGKKELWCKGCHSAWEYCPQCKEQIIRKGAQFCGPCAPIDPNHQADVVKVTGFLGVPDTHKACVTPKRGKTVHTPDCKFDGLFMGVELEVEVPFKLVPDAPRDPRDPDNLGGVAAVIARQQRRRDAEFDDVPGQPRGVDQKKRVEAAMKVRRLLGKQIIVKHDGSLKNGFEIVSGPAPLDYHREKLWKPFFDWHQEEMILRSHDAAYGTCGMHVHVSREPLGWLQIGKMVQFLHAPENYQFVRYMAGRPSSSRYADYLTPKRLRPTGIQATWGPDGKGGVQLIKTTRDKSTPVYRVQSDTINRYTALNLRNPKTVEFRIFRGTLNPGTFFARLEFCNALTKFAAPGVIGLNETTVPRFTSFLMERKKDFPNLLNYLDGEFVTLPEKKEAR